MMNAKKPKFALKPRKKVPEKVMVDEDDDFRQTGRVTFDDRGNAVWEWALGDGAFSTDVSPTQLKKLEDNSLSIAADAAPPAAHDNPLGTKIGYHPYESGKLSKPDVPQRKKDLRRLSEAINLKKQYEAMKKANGSTDN